MPLTKEYQLEKEQKKKQKALDRKIASNEKKKLKAQKVVKVKSRSAKKKKRFNKKKLLEKMKTQRLFIYEEDRLKDKLTGEADTRFGKFIRERDKDKDCITSDLETCEHKIQNCCHRISRGRRSHRWDESNCAGGCVSCNKYHAQDHGASRERREIRESGLEWVDHQNAIKNKRKPTMEELLVIIEKYKQKYKELKQNMIESD